LRQEATYNGPVDSQVSFNATLLNFETVRPMAGVSMNLPTGTSYLPGNQRFTRMDPDLVEVGSYGTGFNINPTVGFLIGINESTAVSFSAGYAWRGVFIKEGVDLSAGGGYGTFNLKRRVNPGDSITINANATKAINNNAIVAASFAYIAESDVTIDGAPSGRAGARYLSNLVVSYQFDERHGVDVAGSWLFQEKNDVPDLAGGLIPEIKDSNSQVIIGSIEPNVQVDERWRLAFNYSVLYRTDNFYDLTEAQFIPAKLKNSVGVSAKYVISPNASVEVRGSHAWIHQETGPLLMTTIIPPASENLPPSMSFRAWNATVSANGTF
jgi:hypothetical protein